MSKFALSLGSVVLMLIFIACGIIDGFNKPPSTWENERCDTTLRLAQWDIIDLVSPFSQADTLKDALILPPQVWLVIIKNGKIQQSNAVFAPTFQAPPAELISLTDSIIRSDTLSWLDRAYLWTLADRPDYPYHRYERLLGSTRKRFIEKRDSMMSDYLGQYPKYKLRINSDLRGNRSQKRHLTMGKSVSPLSQHQFGFASDVPIIYRGRQLQNIRYYKTFMDEIGGKYGLTWGGTFRGFIDPNHVQYFKNSSEMLKQFPELRYEYEAFGKYFKNRVKIMTAAGKADKIEDTQALLATLHDLHKGKACVCDSLAERSTPTNITKISTDFYASKLQSQRDILLIGDLDSQTITLFHPTGIIKTFRLGVWQ